MTVAVIVPARRCPCPQVDLVLGQLRRADIVVVVFNGASAHARCQARWRHDPRYRSVQAANPVGPAAARNAGAATVKEQRVLAFVDADDRIREGWLDAIRRGFLSEDTDVVAGCLTAPRGVRTVMVAPGVDFWHLQAAFGGNLAVRQDAWRRLGGFDADLRCCEDTDLAWRAQRCSLGVGIVRDAIVEISSPSLPAEARQRFRWGWWSVRLLRKHGRATRLSLPSLGIIRAHIAQNGWARWPTLAALSQVGGQRAGLVALRMTAARRSGADRHGG